jgi:hypothetical protein
MEDSFITLIIYYTLKSNSLTDLNYRIELFLLITKYLIYEKKAFTNAPAGYFCYFFK